MKTENSFNVDFDYALTETITLNLSASAKLHHSVPHYIISDFRLQNHRGTNPLLPDIQIMAIKRNKGISWVHTDSFKETTLSAAVGKAIEAHGNVQFAENHE